MNNNISNNFNYIKVNNSKQDNGSSASKTDYQPSKKRNDYTEIPLENVQSALEFLSSYGLAQVSMDNSNSNIKRSVDEFMQDPDYIKAKVDFCDSLLERGYCLEDAIINTDRVFDVLSNDEIYN